MKPLFEIMTEDEFVAHATRIMKLFLPKQPSDPEFLALRLHDNVADDQFLELAKKIADMQCDIAQTANQIFDLWFAEPEGHA